MCGKAILHQTRFWQGTQAETTVFSPFLDLAVAIRVANGAARCGSRYFRAELLHFANWSRLLDGLAMNASRLRSVEEIYNQEIYYQYNLHLMNHSRFEGRIRYQWAWQVS